MLVRLEFAKDYELIWDVLRLLFLYPHVPVVGVLLIRLLLRLIIVVELHEEFLGSCSYLWDQCHLLHHYLMGNSPLVFPLFKVVPKQGLIVFDLL